jgi:pimeloyl-ACP methyl ester carboxylesterase
LTTVSYIDNAAGSRLAYMSDAGQPGRTGVFWLGGFMSDMTGTKAEALAEMARNDGRAFLRFDYRGHGASGGYFEDLTLSAWLEDAFLMFGSLSAGGQIIVGSSMGGYLALLLIRRLQQARNPDLGRIRGLVLLAPAADMTEALLWRSLSKEQREEVMTAGRAAIPSRHGGHIITRKLIEDGRRHLILGQGVATHCPVRILAGEEDADVPWRHALEVYRAIRGDDVMVSLIKGGDHRLSSPRDLDILRDTVRGLARSADPSLASRHSRRTDRSDSRGS